MKTIVIIICLIVFFISNSFSEEIRNYSDESICYSDVCKNNRLMLFKLGVNLGVTIGKHCTKTAMENKSNDTDTKLYNEINECVKKLLIIHGINNGE